MTVLPLAYLGSVHYFARLCFSECVVDVHENYIKQSLRNRCRILSADGITTLTVNVVKTPNDQKRPVRDVRIDYSKRWQHRHWTSLVSAYRSSPYFDHYAGRFEPFYARRYDFLYDLNGELTLLLLELLGSGAPLRFSERYVVPSAQTEDLRHSLSEKPRLHREDARFHPVPYYHVFGGSAAPADNLSVVDLLFCEGPHALDLLRESVTP